MIFADMHCDTLYELLQKRRGGKPGSLAENSGHVDLDKLRRGGALVQNFAMFVESRKCEDPKEEVLSMAALFYEEMERNKDVIAQALSCEDILRNEKQGLISAILTIEEGAACRGSLENLKEFYNLGVRMMTLTWNYPNEIGYPNLVKSRSGKMPDYKKPDTVHGLTEFGILAVQEMERLGMIVDVSHLSDAGFYDVLRYTEKPFAASHSNARAISPWVRNLTDDMIRALAARGGVTGLNFCADFLTEAAPGTPNPGTIQAIVEHAKHIVNVGGIECLGLGSDFDGIETHEELPDYSFLPRLLDAFEKAGFTASECDKICRGNVLRLYRDVLKESSRESSSAADWKQ